MTREAVKALVEEASKRNDVGFGEMAIIILLADTLLCGKLNVTWNEGEETE